MFTAFRRYCVFVSLVAVIEGSFEVSEQKDFLQNCSASAVNQSHSSILVTWIPFDGNVFHQYTIQYWPLYSRSTIHNATTNISTNDITNLEPNTSYQFVIGWNLPTTFRGLCTVLGKTNPNVLYPVNGLRYFMLNATHSYVTWRRTREPGASIAYRAFMEWGSYKDPKVELVYYGNRTSVVVKKETGLPQKYEFYVNVHVVRYKDSLPPIADQPTNSASPHLNVAVLFRGSNFIHLSWNSLSSYYDNVTYIIRYMARGVGHEIKTAQEQLVLENLYQYTAYIVRVQAQDSQDKAVDVASKWMSVMTTDYDECAEQSHMCHVEAKCVNSQGSYSCRCNKGLLGDGYNCTRLNKEETAVDKYCPNTVQRNVTWTRTRIGDTVQTSCPAGAAGIASRKCKKMKNALRASWDDPNLSQCVTKEIADIHNKLQGLTADPIVEARKLAHITKKHIYSGDIKLIVGSMKILLSNDSIQRVIGGESRTRDHARVDELAMSVLNISNEILKKDLLSSWKQMDKISTAVLANKVIESLDSVALMLAKNNEKEDVYAETENVFLSVRGIPPNQDITDQRLPPLNDMREGNPSSVYVPASVLTSQNSDHLRFLSFVSYKTINKILQLEPTTRFTGSVLSPVISVTLTPPIKNKFANPVIITIERPEDEIIGEPTCAFLNVSQSTDISWSSEGCEVGTVNETHFECKCSHLTSFAILMQVRDVDYDAISKKHHFALSLISYIGICTSLVALVIVFLTFAFIRFLKLPRHFIHANLALSMAIAHTTFLFGIDKTETQILCKAIAIALHYLFLVAFSWMALEGVILYLMLVKVFQGTMSGRKTKWIFFACGWGIPAVIVATSSGVYLEGYGTNQFCWLSLEREFIWAFVAPVLAVIAFNFVCLGRTFYVMAKRGSNSNSENTVDKLRYWVRSCCLLTCILGVTWLLGIFFVNKQSIFMAYLFSILNAFQGVVIFLLHCIGDRKIRCEYARLIKCNSDPYSSSSGGAKLLYKQTLSRSGSHSSEPKFKNGKRLEKQSTVMSLLKSPGAIKQYEDEKEEQNNKVRNNEERSAIHFSTTPEIQQHCESSTINKDIEKASVSSINETNNENKPTVQPEWV